MSKTEWQGLSKAKESSLDTPERGVKDNSTEQVYKPNTKGYGPNENMRVYEDLYVLQRAKT